VHNIIIDIQQISLARVIIFPYYNKNKKSAPVIPIHWVFISNDEIGNTRSYRIS